MHRYHVEHHLLNKDIKELYLFNIIRTFAISMVVIFLPVFLWTTGYSLSLILIFFAILVGTHTIFVPVSTYFTRKVGIKHTLSISTPLLILFYFLLPGISAPELNHLFFLLPFIHGVHNAFYWTGNHLLFIRRGIKKKLGQEMGYLRVIMGTIAAIAPFIGGMFILLFGFDLLFLMISALLFISLFPLFAGSDLKEPAAMPKKERPIPRKNRKRVSYLGFGMTQISDSIVWPLVVFFAVSGVARFGMVISLGSFAGIVLLFFASRVFDSKRNRKFLSVASLGNGAITVLRSLATVVGGLYLVGGLEITSRASRPLTTMPFDVQNFKDARTHAVHFFKEREVLINLMGCLSMILFSLFPSIPAILVFSAAGYVILRTYR